MAYPSPEPMTFEAFLDWERRQETRHEFVDGQILAMAGGSQAHNTIQVNILVAAQLKLRGSGCRPFSSDMLTRTGRNNGR